MNTFPGLFSSNDHGRSKRFKAIAQDNERSNLITLTKLVLNTFIERSSQGNRLFDSESQELSDLLAMVETSILHGLKQSSIISRSMHTELWSLLTSIAKEKRDMHESISCIDGLKNLSAPVAKVRAFLRLAVIQKKLSDYLQTLVSNQILLAKYYEEWAFLRNEVSTQLIGTLMPMTIFDCNFILDHEYLKERNNVINLASYVKLPTVRITNETELEQTVDSNLKTILDQKNYLEEINDQLNKRLFNLQVKLDQQTSNTQTSTTDCDKSLIFTERLKDLEKELVETRAQLQKRNEMLEQSQKLAIQRLEEIDELNDKLESFEVDRKQLENQRQRQEKEHLEKERSVEVFPIAVADDIDEEESELSILKSELKHKTTQYCELTLLFEQKQRELNELTDKLDRTERRCSTLESRAQRSSEFKENSNKLRLELELAFEKLRGYEQTLEELSGHLSESKLKVLELKEEFIPLNTEWVPDSDVSACTNCQKSFSVTFRRHHCRRCSAIFCASCSECRVKLPSSSRPVRVCTNCFNLLQKHRSNTSEYPFN
ncbi:RUN and FYVE domain-containing protein 1 [Aphelenchoides besseyi]|nr:RUN and FYVE domain-containing protein 1 [Aphelenchoides besseyi]